MLFHSDTAAYSLPAHQRPLSPDDQQHLVHHYRTPIYAQGFNYSTLFMGPGLDYGCKVLYRAFSPIILSYSTPQHSGMGQSVLRYIPGQFPVYGAIYYDIPYAAPRADEVLSSTGHLRPLEPQLGQVPVVPPMTTNSPKGNACKRTAKAEYDVSKTIVDGSNPKKPEHKAFQANIISASSNTPRGPPRKPKQSAHALWVGRLPGTVNIMNLKDYFSQDATDDIESVLLIPKSNCAFVNYQSAAASAAALVRFHGSVFQSVHLVCRLPRGSTELEGRIGAVASSLQRQDEVMQFRGKGKMTLSDTMPAAPDEGSRSSDRYFIVKSLTVEDLESSKQSGIWATQPHNELKFNNAFRAAKNVYFLFSANKSGEYFGHARMLTPIDGNEKLDFKMPLRYGPLAESPYVTTTVATSTAPEGRIIHDTARGTIFWEVKSLKGEKKGPSEQSVEKEVYEETQSFGRPFRIQWLSSKRVPFHRARGLRNPWNGNREVKVARDGTELEPTVGRKLVSLFNLI
ncbi:Nucleotide-binding alpha-beta plait [Penicillium sp. IBT 35674x]|nr:Nucleotide-binding alpha-beta plait [Penicillium sp. IBT 35674x]